MEKSIYTLPATVKIACAFWLNTLDKGALSKLTVYFILQGQQSIEHNAIYKQLYTGIPVITQCFKPFFYLETKPLFWSEISAAQGHERHDLDLLQIRQKLHGNTKIITKS